MEKTELNNFLENGYIKKENIFDDNLIDSVLNQVNKSRKLDHSLFFSKKEYFFRKNLDIYLKKKIPWIYGNYVNLKKKYFPTPKQPEAFRRSNNLANNLNLDFIEKNKSFVDMCHTILGDNYTTILKKIVISASEHWMPDFVIEELKNSQIKGLKDFVRPKYRDVTYFNGIAFHQDYIDHHGKDFRYMTGYIYLNDVDITMSPLYLILKSHKFLATKFPHNLKYDKLKEEFSYYNDQFDKCLEKLKYLTLTGKKGSAYFWTPYTLHGTPQQLGNIPRISLRYLIKSNSKDPKLPINIIYDEFKNKGFASKLNQTFKNEASNFNNFSLTNITQSKIKESSKA